MKFPQFWKIAVLTIAQATLTPVLAAPASSAGYTVKSGDTFAKIARSRGISLPALLKANKISNPDRIHLGQRIVLPGGAPVTTVAKTTAKTPVKQTAKTTSKNAEVKTVAKTSTKPVEKTEKTTRPENTTVNIAPPPVAGGYTVRTGDTLSRIASRTGVSASQIMSLNGLTEDSKLRVGQTLRTTSSKAVAKKVPAIEQPAGIDEAPVYIQDRSGIQSGSQLTTVSHKVKTGETFSSITRTYGISSSRLAEANRGVDPTRLRVGQSILIPGQPAHEQAKPLTVRADGRVLADHRDPLDPAYASEEAAPATERTRTGYQVEKGDTLADIAQRYNTTPEYLRGLNRMGPSEEVYQGRYLLVPFIPRNPGGAPATARRQDA